MKKLFNGAAPALFSLLLLSASFTRPDPKPQLKGTITYSGTRFLYPLVEKWAEEFSKAHPGVHFTLSRGTGKVADIEASAAPVKVKDSARGQYTVVSRFVLVPVINEKNPQLASLQQKGLSKEDLYRLYFGKESPSGGAQSASPQAAANPWAPVKVYARGACASATFSDHFGKKIKDLNNLDASISDDKVLLQKVLSDSLALGYNNLGFVYDLRTRKQQQGIRVVPIDLDGNGRIDPKENFYDNLDQLIRRKEKEPASLPPVGDLTLIYKGERPEVKAFVEWVRTKGQAYNHAYGFLNPAVAGR
ncbi:hypothetical protein V9K67_14485 [Paraflavisolibacter sp. H34]|uniref:PstS family phosphate ABC transporter substrate-binding protein n=1 Tax=Huijunlia imazamoxiresistens TaxID=3127457 RepID=UPI003018A218